MRCAVELSDVHDVVLVLQNRSLVVVHVEVVRRAEDCHDTGETSRPCFPIHSVSSILRLMCADDRQKVVFLEESARSGIRKEVRASADVVVNKEVVGLLLTEFLEGISPENIAHEAVGGWLAETINLTRSAMALAETWFHVRSSSHPECEARDSIHRVYTRTACS